VRSHRWHAGRRWSFVRIRPRRWRRGSCRHVVRFKRHIDVREVLERIEAMIDSR
jgi:hypothetical protein